MPTTPVAKPVVAAVAGKPSTTPTPGKKTGGGGGGGASAAAEINDLFGSLSERKKAKAEADKEQAVTAEVGV